mgnify:CR=1 FL=1
MNAHDLIKEAIAEKGKFDSVYWIACGGSMIDLIPAHELLQREATTFTSYIYTVRYHASASSGREVPGHRL